jgi:hypothetical protein
VPAIAARWTGLAIST